MRIIPISVPTPFYIGPVNVYLIAEDPLTIIDTGPKTKDAIDALRGGLRRAGFLVSDLRRIVVIAGSADVDRDVLRRVERASEAYRVRVKIKFCTDRPMTELRLFRSTTSTRTPSGR